MKLIRIAALASVVASVAAYITPTHALGADDVSRRGKAVRDSSAIGAVTQVVGDTACPSGYSLATLDEVLANQDAACNQLDTWDIARLSDGGSISGPGYGCKVRRRDTRDLGHAVCKKPMKLTRETGDGVCPSGYTVANTMVARANAALICNYLGPWDIVRLSDGSMSGSGYGCTTRARDTRSLGHTMCVELDFVKVIGDKPCPAGTALLSPRMARARKAELCNELGPWDIGRLDGGGSMSGSGYGCKIRDRDTRPLGHALCGAL
jgi:hypothetical protein